MRLNQVRLLTTSRPLRSTLISFAMFVVISLVLIGMCLLQFFSDRSPAWYIYLFLIVLIPLTLFLIYKVFLNYKIIELGNGQVVIHYPVRKVKKHYPLARVVYWKESTVKTGKNSTFNELEVVFDDQFKLNLGLKEYSNYAKVYAYLTKKLPKKNRSEEPIV